MEVYKINDDLFMFSSYVKFIDLTFNQFLLLGEEAVLIHTGSKDQAVVLAPEIKNLLNGRPLAYIFISHFESDECGGLGYLLDYFPGSKPVCSAVTMRQLAGFGITSQAIIKSHGDVLEGNDFNLEFVSYPSEMHLWEGLLAFDSKRQLLFSSDLLICRGEIKTPAIASNLLDEIQKISLEQIPSQSGREKLQHALENMPIKLVAPGHGPCLTT